MIQVEPQGNFFSYLRLWNQFFWQRAAFSVDRDLHCAPTATFYAEKAVCGRRETVSARRAVFRNLVIICTRTFLVGRLKLRLNRLYRLSQSRIVK